MWSSWRGKRSLIILLDQSTDLDKWLQTNPHYMKSKMFVAKWREAFPTFAPYTFLCLTRLGRLLEHWQILESFVSHWHWVQEWSTLVWTPPLKNPVKTVHASGCRTNNTETSCTWIFFYKMYLSFEAIFRINQNKGHTLQFELVLKHHFLLQKNYTVLFLVYQVYMYVYTQETHACTHIHTHHL